jgi:glycosyltransferase involved in cell wall biosynthesis
MKSAPSVTVVVPVLNGRDLLPISLQGLADSDLPRNEWELLVVDDGSTDGTAEVAARWADRVLSVDGGPKGPGFARNVASHAATGDVMVLVDADVCVHPETIRRIRDHFTDPGVGAVFGAYDDHPSEADFLSQYRNLYHRYVHLKGAGDAETFWAGCGAIRRDLFVELGGFDTVMFPRPQIEDIELGYRIRDAGYRIVLDPEIVGQHLKRWTFRGIVKTDLLDRGIPWMRLLLRTKRDPSLNVGGQEKLKTALMGISCVFLLAALVLFDVRWLAATIVPLAVIVAMNLSLYRWFAGLRGWGFALRVIPMNLIYYLISGMAVAIAMVLHLLSSKSSPGGAAGT